MIDRVSKRERFTRDDLLKVIKEKDDEDMEFTEAKISIYDKYPRQPSAKDL